MSIRPNYPLRFHPIYKERCWGGDSLRRWLGRALPAGVQIGESWEISDRPGDCSVVANGPCAGATLRDLIERYPRDVLGPEGAADRRFPLLIKFISTWDKCSLQVHPPDDYASREHPGELGKTEMWYILETEPRVELLIGFKQPRTAEQVLAAIEADRLEELVQHTTVKADEAFFLPAGRVHGIGAGILLAEIQDNSDLTYRLYDYGRRDAQGRKRDLHVKQALEVLDFADTSDGRIGLTRARENGGTVRPLIADSHFNSEHIVHQRPQPGSVHAGFQILVVTEGEGGLEYDGGRELLTRGAVLLLPAGFSAWTIQPGPAGVGVLYSWVGRRE